MHRFAWLLGIIAAIGAAIVLVPLFIPRASRPAGPNGLVGQAAPIYALRDDAGTPVSLQQYRGKLVVMNLWASWCPPCRAELPDLQRLEDRYGARGVVVVGVDQGEAPSRAGAFARSLGLHFPIWIDAHQRYGRAYHALGLPTTAFISRSGTIVRAVDGPLTYPQMRAAVRALLAAS